MNELPKWPNGLPSMLLFATAGAGFIGFGVGLLIHKDHRLSASVGAVRCWL